jgi:phosphoglycolate phosphatase
VAFEVYRRAGLLEQRASPPYGTRVLHLAPEGVLHSRIVAAVGAGYMPADARPEAYTTIQCLRLRLPDGFALFPDAYFDFIIHNHVLEHIPGSFRDHLRGFARILKPGGHHIFSVPGPKGSMLTVEGGEHLASDAERLAKFGQGDHFKMFGHDLPGFLAELPGGSFAWDDLSDADRAEINVAPLSNRFLVWRKDDRAPRA